MRRGTDPIPGRDPDAPSTVLRDYHELMNLAGYQDVIARDADTALKVNISWHFFFPGSSTVPWQLDGVIRALKADGYDPNLVHACHNRTVVIDAHLGERENKQIDVVRAHGLRNIHLYEGEEWMDIRRRRRPGEAVPLPERGLPEGFLIPKTSAKHHPPADREDASTTMTGNEERVRRAAQRAAPLTHPVIHETLVDLLRIQQRIHRVFADRRHFRRHARAWHGAARQERHPRER